MHKLLFLIFSAYFRFWKNKLWPGFYQSKPANVLEVLRKKITCLFVIEPDCHLKNYIVETQINSYRLYLQSMENILCVNEVLILRLVIILNIKVTIEINIIFQ